MISATPLEIAFTHDSRYKLAIAHMDYIEYEILDECRRFGDMYPMDDTFLYWESFDFYLLVHGIYDPYEVAKHLIEYAKSLV